MKTIVVTGGAGFIGSALIRHLITETDHRVINVDKLTYAGNLESLEMIEPSERYEFERLDICDATSLDRILEATEPDIIMHLAAESHVDRSIDGAAEFMQTNIIGTYTLLECARRYWQQLEGAERSGFRFHHVSTDEVYGDLRADDPAFTESTHYMPSSPYSASKASSDHLVRAWNRTYGLPVVISNCSNNYGPYQFPEKLIPLMILNIRAGKRLPVYGDGLQVRDWLYVDDHARALCAVALQGGEGETYNIGGCNEVTNIDVVKTICKIMDELDESAEGISDSASLIEHVADRPGHDVRYAIDASKIIDELGWRPEHTFETGIRETVNWYLENESWWQRVLAGEYQGERLGLGVSS